MYVYVTNSNGQPLMPTQRCGKVRRLLKENKAKVVKRCPFTIQLLYETEDKVQPVTLGVDAGSKTIGLSATTEDRVLFEAEVTLRSDIVNNLSTRRACRRARRNRKTRYRKPRFDNRNKGEGWLAPSVQNKVNTHLAVVDRTCRLLPISEIVVEAASFDIQKIKNPDTEGTDYQQGEQLGFWNVREYVLFRDNHSCQCCKGRSGDRILNIHHLESRKTGGDSPGNLITLCETCHRKYHKGQVELKVKRMPSYRDAAFMGIMRWAFYNRLKEKYDNVHLTYGYITKNTRIRNNLPKNHFVDARCISNHPMAVSDGTVYSIRKVRCHNRQIHKMSIGKGGYRKRNQAPKYVFGYQLFDKVKMPTGEEGFVFGRRSSGSFDIRKLDGTKLSAGISCKKLQLLEARSTYLVERQRFLPIAEARGIRA